MRVKAGQVVWKQPGAGFNMTGCFVQLIAEDPEYSMPCMLECDDSDCFEWINAHTLDGETLADAVSNAELGVYTGAVYHVSECELHPDRLPDNPSQELSGGNLQ